MRDTDMALRRGIMHYQHGTEDVRRPIAEERLWAAPPVAPPVAPSDPITNPSFRQMLGNMLGLRGRDAQLNPLGTPVPPVAPPTELPGPPSGFGQLLTGQFREAKENPESSPVTAELARVADRASTRRAAETLVNPPSPLEYLTDLFAGNRASRAELAQRKLASDTLMHPRVQQHLINNPDELKLAQEDPHEYARRAQTPAFRQVIETAVDAHALASKNPKIAKDELSKVVTDSVNTGLNPNAIHAGTKPHMYTRDEFVAATEGLTSKHAAMIFGHQLAHVQSPQEKLTYQFFDRLHGNYNAAVAKIKQLEAQDDAFAEQGKGRPNAQSSWGSLSRIDAAKAEADKAMKVIMDATAPIIGTTSRVPGVPDR